MRKYIFVTGGVVSGVGKGITTACLGKLLRDRGIKIILQKIDPYLNVDAGTIGPFEHGEVFVTDDGGETDLDLGHYERFVDINLTKLSSVTTGLVYGNVIAKERRGEYLGKTVQVIPHVTDEIKRLINEVGQRNGGEVSITEIGGTVGDIEGLPYLEAIRQMKGAVGAENVLYVHVTLIAYLTPGGESKTKPTQHSVSALRNIGIQPDVLLCRCRYPLTQEMRDKLSLFCDVPPEAVIQGLDTECTYELPLMFEQQGLGRLVVERLGLPDSPPDHSEWEQVVDRIKHPKHSTTIALVGKYTALGDTYLSVQEAVKHAGAANDCQVTIQRVAAEKLANQGAEKCLNGVGGVLVPGGFGERGSEGKMMAIQYARENKLPFLGLCLGMQCSVIEFARNVCGMEGANTSEFVPNTPYPVIDLLPEQRGVEDKGGTMRLGAYPCQMAKGTLAHRIYGEEIVHERHRHRYEVNNDYREKLAQGGMVFSGTSPDGHLVEMIELKDHPFFIATQAHPEFKSRPNRAHPLFREFVKAVLANG